MSDLQRDIELVDAALGIAFDDADPSAEAWQRIRARLTPDRERDARLLLAFDQPARSWASLYENEREYFLQAADAAIKAMEGEP